MWREYDLVRKDRYFLVWLDDCQLDVEGCDFVGERIAVSFQCPGRCAVHRHSWRPDMSTDPGEDHYVAGVFFAEERESCFDEVDLTEEDDFKLVADEVLCSNRG